ncbi:MAG: glycosyltransferase, partial [Streptomycetaceae bacterium]|nr:glycosyltransferase [Streptomycetaceae bacterium]
AGRAGRLDRGVRGAAGLPDDVPVLVYSGWLAPERGVDTLAEALVHLPDAHAVVVAGDRRPYFAELEARVADLGVAARFHFVPYVEPDEVVDHLATATVGVIPLRHLPNHEISLITKYYEYMHAGLPIVVSDVRTMAAFTRDLGCGEVFPAGDARRLAEAVQRVLADRSRYVKPYAADGFLEEHAWERQADNVAALYERLTGLAPRAGEGTTLAGRIRADAAVFAEPGGSATGVSAVSAPGDVTEPPSDAAAPGREPREAADAAGIPETGPRVVVLVGTPAGADRGDVRELARRIRASGPDTVVVAPDPGGLGASGWLDAGDPDGVAVLIVPAVRTVAAGRDRRRGTDPVQARAARTYAAFLAADPGGMAAHLPGASRALRKVVGGRPGKRLHALVPSLGTRDALPEAFDAEAALRTVLDELRPQVIHACDPVALLAASHVPERSRVRIEYHRPDGDDDGFGLDAGTRRALRGLERAVGGRADVVHGGPRAAAAELSVAAPPRPVHGTSDSPYLVVGPANMAGQGWAWAQAVERYVAGARTEVVALHREGPLRFPADRYLSAAGWESAGVHLALRRHVAAQATHALLESGLPLTGRAARSGHASGDTRALREAGVAVGLVFHGSDVRDPRRHRELYPESPFADPNGALARELQPRYDARMADLADWDGPVFVSTPDLLDFVLDRWPHAVWLPVAVDTGIWRPGPEPLTRDRPVVLHAPSRGTLKSSALIDAVVGDFAARGLVEYRRAADVRPADMPALVADADVVIDQLAIGNVGVLAAQAMAAGRLVVGHAAPRVRERYDGALPQLDATPSTLRGVLESVLDDREHARELAAQGPEFASGYHDGRRSAAALAPFLARHHRTTQGEF